MTGSAVAVDAAGARMGGAARFLVELDGYLQRRGRDDVLVLGRGRPLSPGWLLRRELPARTAPRVVALNNVGFLAPGRERWVLLRNALHFPAQSRGDTRESDMFEHRAQAQVVYAMAKRADVVVVPSSGMAERVLTLLPDLRRRLVVRHHPVTPVTLAPRDPTRGVILVPVLFAGYKNMVEHLTALLGALQAVGRIDVAVQVTADEAELRGVAGREASLVPLGRPSYDRLRQAWARCTAVFFPSRIESFGYPLAEARAAGLPVIAPDTAQNREVAGRCLVPYRTEQPGSLREAVQRALQEVFEPDPAPFAPEGYFDWLLGRDGAG